MKKIVYIINSIKNTGPNQVLKNMVTAIDKNKYKVFVISFMQGNKEETQKLENSGATCICLNLKRKAEIIFRAKRKLNRVLKQINPDIVHTHGIFPDFIMIKIKEKYNTFTTLHCNILEDYPNTYGKLLGKLMILVHFYTLKKINNVITCSESVFNAIKDKFPKNKKINFVRNGITNNIEQNNNQDISKTIYVYSGGINKRKAVLELIQLFKLYRTKEEELIILGTGKELEKCKEQADEGIQVLGFKENVQEYLEKADVYISNSKSEGMSIAIIEALENGLHLFLSKIPSHLEVFKISKEYYLGEYFEKSNFEEKMNKLRRKIKKENRENIKKFQKEYLSAEAMMSEYEKIYEEKEIIER